MRLIRFLWNPETHGWRDALSPGNAGRKQELPEKIDCYRTDIRLPEHGIVPEARFIGKTEQNILQKIKKYSIWIYAFYLYNNYNMGNITLAAPAIRLQPLPQMWMRPYIPCRGKRLCSMTRMATDSGNLRAGGRLCTGGRTAWVTMTG